MDSFDHSIEFTVGLNPSSRGEIIYSNNCVAGRLVCLISVPSFMIPGDFLRHFSSIEECIESIQVCYRMSDIDESIQSIGSSLYMAIFVLRSESDAMNMISNFQGSVLSSTLEPTKCVMYSIKSISFYQNTSSSRISTISNTNMEEFAVDELRNKYGRLFLCDQLYNFDPIKGMLCMYSADLNVVAPSNAESFDAAPNNCPLCLEVISSFDRLGVGSPERVMTERNLASPSHNVCSSFGTFCGHSFHVACARKLQDSCQCPVCRFEHEGYSPSCDARPHETPGSPHRPSAVAGASQRGGGDNFGAHLSSCMVCGWNDSHRRSESGSGMYGDGDGNSAGVGGPSVSSTDAALWCCLVCGFLGCSIYAQNHILHHYQETLHTYALNVVSKQVWDFAGGGYVASRLTTAIATDMATDMGTDMVTDVHPGGGAVEGPAAADTVGVSNRSTAPRKIIEVHRGYRTSSAASWGDLPDNHSGVAVHGSGRSGLPSLFRPPPGTAPPLSTDDENSAINRALELAAAEFNGVYTEQVELCRRNFDEQLVKLRSFMSAEGIETVSESTNPPNHNPTWGKKVLQSLHNEKHKLLQLVDNAERKLKSIEKEVGILNKFNSSLRDNVAPYQASLDASVAELTALESAHRAQVLGLEAELQEKMNQLSNSSGHMAGSSSSGSGCHSGSHSGSSHV